MFLRWMKETLALPILFLTSASVPPCWSMMLPRVGKRVYFLQRTSSKDDWVVIIGVDLKDFGIPLVDDESNLS